MSIPILILGPSGSGKSTGIRNLPSSETFIVNVCKKELPFRGARKNYTEINSETNPNGNMFSSDNYEHIQKLYTSLDVKRKEIKYLIIDDSQYLMVNAFLRKHSTQGRGNEVFALYNDIADSFWKLIWDAKLLRDDLFVIFLHHSEINDLGMVKAKTIGKMLDEKVDIPGMFTIVLEAKRTDEGKNIFITQNNGMSPAKTPMGMFAEKDIDNDLLLVTNSIKTYYEGE